MSPEQKFLEKEKKGKKRMVFFPHHVFCGRQFDLLLWTFHFKAVLKKLCRLGTKYWKYIVLEFPDSHIVMFVCNIHFSYEFQSFQGFFYEKETLTLLKLGYLILQEKQNYSSLTMAGSSAPTSCLLILLGVIG